MANLEEISSLLNVDLKLPKRASTNQGPVSGRKRRPWLGEEPENTKQEKNKAKKEQKKQTEVIFPNDKNMRSLRFGSIDQVDQPEQFGSIDQVDQPEQFGSINLVSKRGVATGSQEPVFSLKNLRGNPLKLINFLFDTIEDHSLQITRKIPSAEIMKTLAISRDSAKTASKFLCKNKLLKILEFKSGTNGWSKYSVDKSAYYSILKERQSKTTLDEAAFGSINQVDYSSSNYIINKTTTTSVIDPNQNPNAWDEIDVSLLAGVGFGKNHVLQLKAKSTPQIVQESINHFAFGLQNNEKTKSYKDPVSVLMGVLRKGEAWIETAYKSPQEIAIEKLLAQKKAENTRLQQLDEKLQDEYFAEWSKDLTEEQITTIVGDKITGPKSLKERAQKGLLQEYFKKNEWPKLKESIFTN